MLTDRRRYPRVKLPNGMAGSLGLPSDVRLMDLSPAGAMIEHMDRLSPGGTCVLGVRLGGVDLRLRTRIAWSRVHSAGKDPSGEGELRFRSGLQFLDFPERAETHIRHYLATLRTPEANTTEASE